MKHFLNASRTDVVAFALILEEPLVIGRFLVLLASISMLTMPLTQDIWTWDRFLRGGQDFEAWTFTIVIILCLAVLLSQLCKRRLDLLFAACRMLAFAFKHGELQGRPAVRTSVIFRLERVKGASIDNSFPLKI